MPNTTVRANARVSPKLAARPEAIRSQKSSSPPALAAVPPEPLGDAQIFAVVNSWRALKPKIDEAYKAVRFAENALIAPEFPRALFAAASDRRIFANDDLPAPGKPYGKKDVDSVRIILGITHILSPSRPTLMEIVEARGREIVEAWNHWNALNDTVVQRSGIGKAERQRAEIGLEESALLKQLALTPAQTSAGTMAKLNVASAGVELEKVGLHVATKAECTAADVLQSVAADFKRLGLAGSEHPAPY